MVASEANLTFYEEASNTSLIFCGDECLVSPPAKMFRYVS